MNVFSATVDAKEVDLVNKVAAIIDPLAFDRESQVVGTPEVRQAYERTQESGRIRAREIALSVIEAVRSAQQ